MSLNTRNKRRAALGWRPVVDDRPAARDVRLGVDYDDGKLTGTLALPDEAAVVRGIGYGAGGTEFEGEFSPTVVVGEGLVVAITEDALRAALVEDAVFVEMED